MLLDLTAYDMRVTQVIWNKFTKGNHEVTFDTIDDERHVVPGPCVKVLMKERDLSMLNRSFLREREERKRKKKRG